MLGVTKGWVIFIGHLNLAKNIYQMSWKIVKIYHIIQHDANDANDFAKFH